jgi:hypothetical protein
MPPKLFRRLFTTVPIFVLATNLLHSHFYQKSSSKVAPGYSSKPVMTTKIAQLGGTASTVAVGKIGVSAPFIVSNIVVDTLLIIKHGLMMMTCAFLFMPSNTNTNASFPVGAIRQSLTKTRSPPSRRAWIAFRRELRCSSTAVRMQLSLFHTTPSILYPTNRRVLWNQPPKR